MSDDATTHSKDGAVDIFSTLDGALASDGPTAALDRLVEELETEGKYQEVFEVLVMKSRHELGLPLIQIGAATDIPDEYVTPHEDAIAKACRRVGGLFLADGDLGRAWPYLRAVGETAGVRETIEAVEPGTRRKDIDTIVEIAINEGLHPSRGLEIVVQHHGICSAITNFEQFNLTMKASDQEACARVLARALYADLLESIRSVVEEHRGADRDESSPAEATPVEAPPADGLMDLIRSRPDLFEDDSYYIDTSHLWSVVRFCSFLNDPDGLRIAIELTEYGRRLSSMYTYESEPPFEDYYPDHQVYFEGILANTRGDREAAQKAAAHFVARARTAIEKKERGYPTKAFLTVLTRIGCLDQAIDLAVEFDATEGLGPCLQPSVYELCQIAGDHERLAQIARQRQEPVAFAAGIIQNAPGAQSAQTIQGVAPEAPA